MLANESGWLENALAGILDPEMAGRMMALEQFIFRMTLPLITNGPNGRVGIGTGTLFQSGDDAYIVTAGHVVDAVLNSEDHVLSVPPSPEGGTELFLFSTGIARSREASDLRDLAVVKITDRGVARSVLDGWQALTLDHLGSATDTDSFYVTAGYPGEYVESSGPALFPGLFCMVSTRYGGEASARNFDPDVHLLSRHMNTGQLADTSTVESPDLRGISGATTWSLDFEAEPPDGDLWKASDYLRAVAVETAYLRGRYVKSTHWKCVASLLARFDRELGTRIAERLGLTGPPSPHTDVQRRGMQ